MNFTKNIAPSLTTTGFTLIELIVAMSLVMILFVFSVAPYNFYADKSRVRLSVERVEQLMNKAKLLAGTGYAPEGKNVDLVVHIGSGSLEVVMYSIPTNSPVPPITSPDRKIVEKMMLESNVIISQIGGGSTVSGIDIVYRSPTGISQVWETPSSSVTPILLSGTTLSGGILGVK